MKFNTLLLSTILFPEVFSLGINSIEDAGYTVTVPSFSEQVIDLRTEHVNSDHTSHTDTDSKNFDSKSTIPEHNVVIDENNAVHLKVVDEEGNVGVPAGNGIYIIRNRENIPVARVNIKTRSHQDHRAPSTGGSESDLLANESFHSKKQADIKAITASNLENAELAVQKAMEVIRGWEKKLSDQETNIAQLKLELTKAQYDLTEAEKRREVANLATQEAEKLKKIDIERKTEDLKKLVEKKENKESSPGAATDHNDNKSQSDDSVPSSKDTSKVTPKKTGTSNQSKKDDKTKKTTFLQLKPTEFYTSDRF